MKRRHHTIQAWLVNWAGATVFLALFFGCIYLAEQDMQDAAKLSALDIRVMQSESRMQRAARALCVAELGLGATPAWTSDGLLICKPRPETAELVAEAQP